MLGGRGPWWLVMACAVGVRVGVGGAQSPLGGIAGTVYDSLRNAPLAGALVIAEGTSSATRTDEGGHFRLDSLAPGAYRLTVESDALDSLGVEATPRTVTVTAGSTSDVQLAVPSTATLLALACPAELRGDDSGLLLGTVRDAAGGGIVARAAVEVTWFAWGFTGGRMTRTREGIATNTSADGSFRACGVPAPALVAVRARAGARASGEVDVRLPDFRLARHDLTVGAPGEGTVHGTVSTAAGAPVVGARVQLAGDSAFVLTSADGAFSLADVQSGSQTLEVRGAGFADRRVAMDLRARSSASVAIVLAPPTVPAVGARATAGPGAPGADPVGFEARRRQGVGHFIGPAEIASRGHLPLLDLLRSVSGMEVSGSMIAWTKGGRRCTPLFYVDGAQTSTSSTASGVDIEGVEVYDRGEAPSRYGGTQATCAVVLVWTRAALPAPGATP